jgi:hypothetical protein
VTAGGKLPGGRPGVVLSGLRTRHQAASPCRGGEELNCAHCPALEQCRAQALAVREPYGVWGGLTPAEREALVTGVAGTSMEPSGHAACTVAGHRGRAGAGSAAGDPLNDSSGPARHPPVVTRQASVSASRGSHTQIGGTGPPRAAARPTPGARTSMSVVTPLASR